MAGCNVVDAIESEISCLYQGCAECKVIEFCFFQPESKYEIYMEDILAMIYSEGE